MAVARDSKWHSSACSPRTRLISSGLSTGTMFMRGPLGLLLKIMRKIHRPKRERLAEALTELFHFVEGGSLIVRVPSFNGVFEIGSQSHILRRILVSRDYEPELVRIVRKNVDPGRDAIDVGANVGLFSVLLSTQLAASRRVLAVEPAPGALKYLRGNINMNSRTGTILLFPGIAARHRGEFEINVIAGMEEYSTIGNLAHPAIRERSYEKITVPGESIDNLVEKFGLDPGFIKIDTEGAEYEVLVGCERTVRTHRPIILCESWPDGWLRDAGGVPGAALGLLKSWGYRTAEFGVDVLAFPE
jgi:FkbM family methyltransferase